MIKVQKSVGWPTGLKTMAWNELMILMVSFTFLPPHTIHHWSNITEQRNQTYHPHFPANKSCVFWDRCHCHTKRRVSIHMRVCRTQFSYCAIWVVLYSRCHKRDELEGHIPPKIFLLHVEHVRFQCCFCFDSDQKSYCAVSRSYPIHNKISI